MLAILIFNFDISNKTYTQTTYLSKCLSLKDAVFPTKKSKDRAQVMSSFDLELVLLSLMVMTLLNESNSVS